MEKDDNIIAAINDPELTKKILMSPQQQPVIATPIWDDIYERQRELDKALEYSAKMQAEKHTEIISTAQEARSQTTLLYTQLEEVKVQNELLKTQNDSLNALCETTKAESEANKRVAEKSAKEAKKSRIIALVSLVFTVVIGVVSILVAALF